MQEYLDAVGFIRYLRDLPTLNYHFGKLGPDGWKAMVEADAQDSAPDPVHEQARRLWLDSYALPELRRARLTTAARRDLSAAVQAGRVPNWVLGLLTAKEFKTLEVRK